MGTGTELYLPKTLRTSKIKTRQTGKYPISTKQIVALFVHTKINKTIKYSGIEHAEKSNIGKNSKSNEVHTWTALVAIAPFPSPSSSQNFSDPPIRALSMRVLPPNFFSHIHISTPKGLNLFLKGKFSYFLYSLLPFSFF